MDIVQLLKDWFRLKLVLWNRESKTVFKQGELWWCSLRVNLGEGIFGKGSWYVEISQRGRKSWVMLNQARILDKKRLTNRIGTLDDKDFQKVKQRFLDFYNT